MRGRRASWGSLRGGKDRRQSNDRRKIMGAHGRYFLPLSLDGRGLAGVPGERDQGRRNPFHRRRLASAAARKNGAREPGAGMMGMRTEPSSAGAKDGCP